MKNSHKNIIVGFLLVIVVLIVCVGSYTKVSLRPTQSGSSASSMETVAKPKIEWATYTDPAGFQMDVPKGWMQKKDETTIFFTSPDSEYEIVAPGEIGDFVKIKGGSIGLFAGKFDFIKSFDDIAKHQAAHDGRPTKAKTIVMIDGEKAWLADYVDDWAYLNATEQDIRFVHNGFTVGIHITVADTASYTAQQLSSHLISSIKFNK